MDYIVLKPLVLNGKRRNPGEIVADGEFLPRRALALVRTGMISQVNVPTEKTSDLENPAVNSDPENPENSNKEGSSEENPTNPENENASESVQNGLRQPENPTGETASPKPEKARSRPQKAKDKGDA